MNKQQKNAKSTLDSATPKPDTRHLSEADKKKLELGEQMEHEHGGKREALQKDISALDKKSR
ncbi:MAG TPA: hypothetical protein VG733_03160 [Chthoniobacteraceae bacterium]|nr:hypothetical protein [Chthoniobacteraceae bacterium]